MARTSRLAARTFGPFFIGTGTMHFMATRWYEAIVPDWIPNRRAVVYVSGVAEMLGGLGVLFPRTRRLASWWSVGTLVAVFPANVHMALNPDRYKVPGGRTALYLRLPLQVPVIMWAWAAGRTEPASPRATRVWPNSSSSSPYAAEPVLGLGQVLEGSGGGLLGPDLVARRGEGGAERTASDEPQRDHS